MALPKNRRIKRKNDFEKVFKTGRSVRHPFFLLKFLNSSLPFCRAAVVVSVAVSKKAADRNKIKRTFWAALKKIFPRCRPGVDLVILVYVAAKEKNFYQIFASIEEIFIKANIVEDK